jgi:hypothetical protein
VTAVGRGLERGHGRRVGRQELMQGAERIGRRARVEQALHDGPVAGVDRREQRGHASPGRVGAHAGGEEPLDLGEIATGDRHRQLRRRVLVARVDEHPIRRGEDERSRLELLRTRAEELAPALRSERPHYDVVFHVLAVRNTARYAPALFEPGPDARHDWQILLGLTRRIEELRDGKSAARSLKHAALERLGVEGLLDLALRAGPHGLRLRPPRRGLRLKTLRASEHGVDLGALEPSLPGRLGHRDRRVRLAPAQILADVARLRAAFSDAAPSVEPGELLLIGRRHVRDNNSWMHNLPRLVRGPKRCTLMMHDDDARARGLHEGESAVVTSRVGEVTVPVALTNEVMPGVVCLPHGYGHGRSGVRLAVAAEHAGVSMNDLTDDAALDELCGTAMLSGVPVRVRRGEPGYS